MPSVITNPGVGIAGPGAFEIPGGIGKPSQQTPAPIPPPVIAADTAPAGIPPHLAAPHGQTIWHTHHLTPFPNLFP